MRSWIKTRVAIVVIAIAGVLSCQPVHAQLTEGQAAIVGGIIGYVVGKDKAGREVPQPVYVYPQPAPAPIVHPQYPGYDATGGYCPYQGEAYYHCLGNLQRLRNEEAYRRGLNGLR